jgi:hypothetical protein
MLLPYLVKFWSLVWSSYISKLLRLLKPNFSWWQRAPLGRIQRLKNYATGTRGPNESCQLHQSRLCSTDGFNCFRNSAPNIGLPRNSQFCSQGTGLTGSIVVRYSEINSGLPNNNWFICQDSVATVNLMWESTCNVFMGISCGNRFIINVCFLCLCFTPGQR